MIPLVFFLLLFILLVDTWELQVIGDFVFLFLLFLVTVCLDIGQADGLLCRRITATWSGKDTRLYSVSRQRISRQSPCIGFETVGCPMQNPSDESVLLAVLVRMIKTSGSALDTFARFHFSNGIHLCNNFLGLVLRYLARLESNSILHYDTTFDLNCIGGIQGGVYASHSYIKGTRVQRTRKYGLTK